MRQLLLEEVRKVNAIFWFLILEEDDLCTTCPKWPCPSEANLGEDTHASRRTRAHPARYRHHVSVSIPCCILQKRVWHAVSLDSFLSIDRAHVVTTESQSLTPRPNILCVLKAVWQGYRLDGTRFFRLCESCVVKMRARQFSLVIASSRSRKVMSLRSSSYAIILPQSSRMELAPERTCEKSKPKIAAMIMDVWVLMAS